jgi:hypothetical protein
MSGRRPRNDDENAKKRAGQCTAPYDFAARSFGVWTADVTQVRISGDAFELCRKELPDLQFDADCESNELGARGNGKKCEPGDPVIGRLGDRTFALNGLERGSGVIDRQVSESSAPVCVA